jgi:hypothetical protein
MTEREKDNREHRITKVYRVEVNGYEKLIRFLHFLLDNKITVEPVCQDNHHLEVNVEQKDIERVDAWLRQYTIQEFSKGDSVIYRGGIDPLYGVEGVVVKSHADATAVLAKFPDREEERYVDKHQLDLVK